MLAFLARCSTLVVVVGDDASHEARGEDVW